MTPESDIRHSEHYEEVRIARSLPESCGGEVLQNADAHYYDTLRGRFIAVKRMYVLGAERDIAVAYEREGKITLLVTIFPLKEGQQQNRRGHGRWAPYEPESQL